ncbi:MAG: ATP-binding protein [Planctomycetota bacterium]
MNPIAGKMRRWIVGVFVVMLIDMWLPPQWGFCGVHWIMLPLAWRHLHRRYISQFTTVQVAAAAAPAVVSMIVWLVGSGDADAATAYMNPYRLWTIGGLVAAAYFHVHLLGRLRRRLSHQRVLQSNVRAHSRNVRRVNRALRDEVARREATQYRLDKSETTFQSIIDRMNLQVARKNVEGVFTYANDVFCEQVGKTPADVVGSTDSELYDVSLAEAYRRDDMRVIATGQAIDKVEEHPIANGGRGFAQVFKAPEFDQDGRCVGIQVIFWDVTDKHRHAMTMRESEARKRALFDAAGDAVVLIDESEIVVEANPSADQLLRRDDETLVGQPLQDLVVAELDLATNTPLQRHEDRVRPERSEESGKELIHWSSLPLTRRHHLTLRRGDESRFDSEVSVHRIPVGEAEGRAVVIRDVTMQRQAFEAMREAMAVAEQANLAKTQFMAGISHELRTPLVGIQGLTDLLQAQALPSSARRYVNMMADSTQLLADTIEDILDFAAIEAGRVGINPTPVDLHAIFGDAFGCLAVRVANRPVRLALSIDPRTPRRVRTDAKRLRQIVVNLAGNAIKFTTEGEVAVRLEPTGPVDESNRQLLAITVTDTGIGIDSEHQARIFDAFEQADRGTNKRYGGTGLGLAIARGLAQRLDGDISLSSEPGRGSTFQCLFRAEVLQRDEEPAIATPNPDDAAQMAIVSVGNASIRDSIAETLLAQSWTVDALDSSPNGHTAVSELESGAETVDVVHWILTESTADAAFQTRARRVSDRVMWITKAGDGAPRQAIRKDVIIIEPVLPDEVRRWSRGETVLQQERGIVAASRLSTHEFAEGATNQRRYRILVVDDSATNRLVIHDQLATVGHHVEIAPSGREAIARVQQAHPSERTRFDCVLMDLQMPDMDGTEATKSIQSWYARCHPTFNPPPVIALTAHITEQHRQLCHDAGMAGYVTKPVRLPTLLSEMDRIVGERAPIVHEIQHVPPPESPTTSIAPTQPTPPDESNDATWRDRLASHCGHDPATIESVREAIQLEVPTLLRRIQTSARSGDQHKLKTAVHTLKSCLRYVADPEDVEVAKKLEMLTDDPAWVAELQSSVQSGDESDSMTMVQTLDQISKQWVERISVSNLNAK